MVLMFVKDVGGLDSLRKNLKSWKRQKIMLDNTVRMINKKGGETK